MPGCRKGEKYYDNTEYKRAERKNNGAFHKTTAETEKAIPYPTKKKSYRSMQSGMDFYIRSSLSTTVYPGQPLKEQTLSVCSL